ncbi:MAG: DUF4349 domain-containing protein [Anaerolineae bacterium]|nr:DUF4349 domain-containing protein [Anaerolineae bacterium]
MSKKILCGVIVSLLLLAVTGCFAVPSAMEVPMEERREVMVTQVVEKEAAADWDAAGAPAGSGANYDEDAGPAVAVERLIIRNAWLDLVVPDTEDALAEIEDVTSEMGGYIVESSVYQYGESKRATVQLRIPAEKLDEALEHFRGMATEVRSENISGQDVTDEYVDLQSRLRSKEATEAKLLEFLEEAEDTEAALEVYAQLERIQTDIEVIKGRMQYLEQSAAMSSVTIELTPDELAQPIEIGGWHPEGTLRDSVEALIRVLQFLVDALIVIVVVVLPVVIVIFGPLVGLFFVIRAIVRKRRARKAE